MSEAWHVLERNAKFIDGWHIGAITDHLEAVHNGEINRLLINVPPGSSKSLTTSVLFPAWEWGPKQRPFTSYLSTSHNDTPVKRDIRKHRNLVLSEWYQTLWPDFELTRTGETGLENNKGGFREGSSFGSLTSLRADRLLIDDPHSTETAESDVERVKTVRIFREGALDRINDENKSAIIVIMQRLHESDISGEIINNMKEQGFVHLMIPMEYEADRHCTTRIGFSDPRTHDHELMDPVRFPEASVRRLESGKGPYAWAGQYQQRPAPREGGMFKVDNILIVDSAPYLEQRTRGWDIAGSTRKTSPFTAGCRLGRDPDTGIIYVEDMQRARAEIEVAEKLIVDTAINDGFNIKQSLPQDPGQAGKSQRRQLASRLAKQGNFSFSPESGAKEDRAIPVASMVNAGMVRFVRGAWNQAAIDELRNFPAGTYKDQVDALSRAYSEIIVPEEIEMEVGPIIHSPEDY